MVTTETQMRLYAVQDYNATRTLLLVDAAEPLEALDAFAEREGFLSYSRLMEERPDDWGWDTGGLFTTPQGFVGAVFTNFEIVAVPVTPPLHLAVGQAGWGIADAIGLWLADGHDSVPKAVAAIPGGHPDIVCARCGQLLGEGDVASALCDSCETQAAYDKAADLPDCLVALEALLSHDRESLVVDGDGVGLLSVGDYDALVRLRQWLRETV